MNNTFKSNITYWLNQIPPGESRAKFVLAMILVMLSAFIFFPAQSGQIEISAVLIYFTYKLLGRITKLYPAVARRLIRKTWRLLIGVREFYKVSEEVELFHAMTMVVMLTFLVVFLVTKNLNGYSHYNTVILLLLSSAAIFDVRFRLSWLAKKAWAKVLGKAAIAGLGAAIIYVASAMAKQHIASFTHADPKYFPEYAGLLTSIYTPILFGIALTGIGILWASLEFTGVILGLGFIVMPLSALIKELHGKEASEKFFRRIKSGKSKTIDSTNSSSEWKRVIYVMRPIALASAIFVIASSFGSITSYFSNGITYAEKNVLMMMHYRPNSECANIDKKTSIANLKDGMVSVALITSNDIIFNAVKCNPNTN